MSLLSVIFDADIKALKLYGKNIFLSKRQIFKKKSLIKTISSFVTFRRQRLSGLHVQTEALLRCNK